MRVAMPYAIRVMIKTVCYNRNPAVSRRHMCCKQGPPRSCSIDLSHSILRLACLSTRLVAPSQEQGTQYFCLRYSKVCELTGFWTQNLDQRSSVSEIKRSTSAQDVPALSSLRTRLVRMRDNDVRCLCSCGMKCKLYTTVSDQGMTSLVCRQSAQNACA